MSVASIAVWHAFDTPFGPHFWKNTWELDLGVAGFWANDLTAIGQAFATFHRTLLYAPYKVDHVAISTYVPDGKPYNPDNVAVIPVGLVGLGVLGGGVKRLPLTDVLALTRQTVRGRPGTLFLRGYLTTEKLADTSAGVVGLANPEAVQAEVEAAFAALKAAMPAGARICLASGKPAPTNIREVIEVTRPRIGKRSSTRRVKKVVPRTSPFYKMAEIVGDLKNAAPLVNDIIGAFNALPLPDLPLLPG